MDLPGATFFTSLASLSVAFVGFSTIAIAFLNVTQSRLAAQHIALVRIFVTHGLSAVAFALLPILMRLLGLPEDVIWRFSSALFTIAALILLWSAFSNRRRHALPFPPHVLVNFAIGVVICVLAALNATGLLFDPYVGPYAWAVTLLLVISALIFIENLYEFLQLRSPGPD
jgi:hypothetical protein